MRTFKMGRFGRIAAASAVAAAVSLGGGTAAFASSSPPDGGGGATNCEPNTYIYASGSKIVFEGWTRCADAEGFQLEIGYNRVGGKSYYSSLHTCRGPLAGSTTSAETSCGINGVTATLTDSLSGKQKWCVNTLIQIGSPDSKHEWSTAGCISH